MLFSQQQASEAAKQYKLALKKLKKKIKQAGGKIKINTDELNELQEIYCIKIKLLMLIV